MAITSLGGISNAQAQTGVANASDKLQSVLNSIVSGTDQSADVANVSIASQLQSQTAGLNVAAGNLTQALSLTQVASGGLGQIAQAIGQLQTLAEQAQSPTLNANNRKQLNQQFQQLASSIDNIAESTSFNGQNLLDGSLSGAGALSLDGLLGQTPDGNDTTLSIPDSGTGSLFGGQSLDILSSDDASQAVGTLDNALNQVTGTQTSVGAFQQTLNYAAGNVDSAINNYQAAASSLGDTDIAEASTQNSLAQVQYNAAIAVEAQTNNLNPALLQLIG